MSSERPVNTNSHPAVDPASDRAIDPADPSADPAAELAERCVDLMWERDQASRRLDMRIVAVSPGRASVAMPVRDDMINGHGNCHGGFLATLADSAFAFACNTYGDLTVAAGFDMVFLASARLGDELLADARERARFGRSGLYDVTVSRADGTVIAEFRGRSRSLGRPLIPHDARSTR